MPLSTAVPVPVPSARTCPAQPRHSSLPAPAALAAAALVALLSLLVMLPAPALADAPRSVSVTDTDATGRVDPEILEGRLAKVDFRREVDLAVLVLDITDYGFDESEDTALNDAVLAHARDAAPDLLAPDGDHWADGTVIIALDPENRFVGTYAGEDVKLGDDGFEAVQEAMRDHASEDDWDGSLQAGAEKYADLLDRPWWQHPAALVSGLVALGVAALTALSFLGLRRAARRRVDESLPRLEDVQAKRRLTDAAARTLPVDSVYAQAALADHETYREKLDEAEQLRAQIPTPHERGWGWGLKGPQRTLARDLESTVTYLDDIDDDIIGTNDLLHRLGDWRSAWDRELKPLQDSIDSLDDALADGEDVSSEEAAAAADLREMGGDVAQEMQTLTTQLEADQIDPDSALQRLDTLTTELSAAVAALQRLRISHLAADDDEAEVMREATFGADLEHEDQGYRSVRGRRHELDAAASGSSGSSDTFWHLSPLLWYSTWHHEADSDLESHRNPSSSGGSTSGYSAASGGFSGAGSSSRF